MVRILEVLKAKMANSRSEERDNKVADRDHGSPDVVWNISGDGLRPKQAPWGFVAQNPFSRVIPPKAKLQINLHVAANVPLMAFPRGDQADYVSVPLVIPAGQNVVVTVENKSEHQSLLIEDKESLVNLHPLVFRGTSDVA